MIHLTEELLVGAGGVRKVYKHPWDEDKCIKITFNKERRRAVYREIRYLKKYRRQGKPFDHLSRFHGFTKTNLGRGAVFDLIRDYDGSISCRLSDHVAGKVANPLSPPEIISLLTKLKSHFLTHRIIVSDPAPHNIMVQFQAPGNPQLVLIDGIGNPHFIKVADFSLRHAHRIISKKWRYYVENNETLSAMFASNKDCDFPS